MAHLSEWGFELACALIVVMMGYGCANPPPPLREGSFDEREVPDWFNQPPHKKEVAYQVRTATGKTAQAAVLRATTLTQCGLHVHNEDGEMWVEKQRVIQEGPTQFRAYVLGAKKRKEGE